MLGSSKTGREYNQEQILLNSVSSIGIPLSLTTANSTTNTTGTPSTILQHPVTSLPLSTSNTAVGGTSSSSSSSTTVEVNNVIEISKSDIKDISKKGTNVTINDTTAASTNSLKTGTVSPPTSLETQKSDITKINSDLKISTEDISFKFQDENSSSNSTSSSSTLVIPEDSTTEEGKTKYEGLSTSLFLTSSLPINLDDPESANSFLNSAIDMDIDLLNSSFANNLGDLNMDIATDATIVASNTTSVTPTISATTSVATHSDENTTITNATGEAVNTKTSTSDILLKESDLNALNSITTTTTTGSDDKKDILDFLNTEDLENNLKLFPFTDQSLLLSNQKDLTLGADGNVQGLTGALPLLNDPTLTDPSSISVISNSTPNPNIANATTATTSSKLTTTNKATTNVKVSSVQVSTGDAAMTLNHPTSITMNVTATVATDAATIKVDSTIPPQAVHPNPGDLLGAQNALMAIPPNMMNDPSAYYNMATTGHPTTAGLPPNPAITGAPKVGYYTQPTPADAVSSAMVKAPTASAPGPQNEIIMKKAYNVKQDNMNDIQKNQQNRDTNVKNTMNNGNYNK
ncbi:hypothetical protein PIROE2DRAFT_8688 [Piromyces sp. E2]|nr:hypothetical protein PIROE2DRAFT_8688 [Piromyces sp. E2]|eukprot:OUM64528.1 hypothetical protein PIROE2DRAFT_8688 [Piromyces sp. E2]